MNTLPNGSPQGEGVISPNVEVTPGIIPEATDEQKGVSVRYVNSPDSDWYVLRASYGREVKVRDLLLEKGIYAHVAQRYDIKEVNGKRKKVLISLLPNLLFAYIPRTQVVSYVKDPVLSTLVSFYYNHFEFDEHDAYKNRPLIIAEKEMISFIRATSTKSMHLKNVDLEKCRFLDNQMVEVIKGNYMGVKGRIARVAGQQCIVVSLANGKWNISTDYIPTPFIRILQ